MNQTEKNCIDYSDSALHFLKVAKKTDLTKAQRIEFIDMTAPLVMDFVNHHNLKIKVSKAFVSEYCLFLKTSQYKPTKTWVNNYMITLRKIINATNESQIDLSQKTKFICELSDKITNFDDGNQIDPELNRIHHASTAELVHALKTGQMI